jgi:hypothetical protein
MFVFEEKAARPPSHLKFRKQHAGDDEEPLRRFLFGRRPPFWFNVMAARKPQYIHFGSVSSMSVTGGIIEGER